MVDCPLALNDLRRRCAIIVGADPETWPEHGDVAGAITAALAVQQTYKDCLEPYKINSEGSVAVATDYFWLPLSTAPIGVKLQLLTIGGVAIYSHYTASMKSFIRGWAPLPKVPPGGLEE